MDIPMQTDNESTLAAKSQKSAHALNIEKAPDVAPAPPKKALAIVGAIFLVLVLAAIVSIFIRSNESKALARETERSAIPYVAVVTPTLEKPDDDLTLPSSLQAYKESPIFARTSGYLVNWTKDIGSKVRQGELLARIDTPEVDQELLQARATRQQVDAQMQFAKTSSDRWQNLRKSDAVSQQEADTQSSGYDQARANLAAADANVRRLEQLESFKNVYAPFSGVITRRNVDPGALITAGSGGRELFDLAQVDPIRVFLNVPQSYASQMKVGTHASVDLQEMPGQKFVGTIARTADSIDPATRTLLVEVDIPNKDGRLLPGAYAQVHIHAGAASARRLTVPVNAMLFRQEGAQVGVVGADSIVHLRPISIGRDYGTSLEVLQGVQETDRIIINPSDSLQEGQKVNIASNSAPGQEEGQKQ
jgi:membrane fusion protein, multidrug efflux system